MALFILLIVGIDKFLSDLNKALLSETPSPSMPHTTLLLMTTIQFADPCTFFQYCNGVLTGRRTDS